jgi:hypothetical protein
MAGGGLAGMMPGYPLARGGIEVLIPLAVRRDSDLNAPGFVTGNWADLNLQLAQSINSARETVGSRRNNRRTSWLFGDPLEVMPKPLIVLSHVQPSRKRNEKMAPPTRDKLPSSGLRSRKRHRTLGSQGDSMLF